MILRHLSFAALGLGAVACWYPTSTDGTNGTSSGDDGAECRADSDCAFLDTDSDACTRAACRSGRCEQELVKRTAECQCHGDDDCKTFENDCSSGKCDAHQCKEVIVPAGPAPKQTKGDCSTVTCDGANRLGANVFDAADVPGENPCVVSTCEEGGMVKTVDVAAGTACGAGGICFSSKCLTCKPQDAASCGGEGPNEPQNATGAGAGQLGEYSPFCAFSSGADVDWYTFHANDGSLSYDILSFETWSTAATIEVCAFVKCDNGQAPGGDGCTATTPGPNGSMGCCWSGAPSTVRPSWDLDCPNTGEDSGTVYVSVRTPGASACETYALVGGY